MSDRRSLIHDSIFSLLLIFSSSFVLLVVYSRLLSCQPSSMWSSRWQTQANLYGRCSRCVHMTPSIIIAIMILLSIME